ncbi:Uncharacterized protein OBRU01_03027 [Operophtera brumata]|uniref:Uncharacterized protein n=1 Tax=Operophtera brumata TaxID=104452 RepID=A0A0L7LRF2_OPEBR|nr:Uncharacterized protein OBRU01_03027 [Operophtera brumata]
MMPNMAHLSGMPTPFLPGGAPIVPMHYPMQQKMPMVVMPYYSKSADKGRKQTKRKKRKPKKIRFDDSSCEEDDSSSSASGEFNVRAKPKSKRRQVLTPVVSYVTKDGYVVYQKKIKKDRARDWLEMGKRARESKERQTHERDDREEDKEDDREELVGKLKKLKKHRKNHRHKKRH